MSSCRFWVSGLEDFDFELDVFGRVVKQAFDAHLKRNDEKFEFASRWISGEFNNREINKMLNLSRVNQNEQNLIAKRVGLSLYQLIKRAGFTGTVVGFDEAEQGFSISSRRMSQLLSLLQSDINSINELSNGSVLIIYAITPDILEKMMEFAALQQRIQNPLERMGFWEGNTRAPLIELTRTTVDVANELAEIGKRLIDLFYLDEGVKTEVTVPKEDVISKIKDYAIEVSNKDRSLSDRRDMVRVTCSTLIYLYDNDELIDFDFSQLNEDEKDFDDEG